MTTICQAGGSDYVALNLERAIDAGEIDVPEMFVSGPSLISANAVDAGRLLRMFAKIARDPDDATRPVRH